MEHGDKFRSIGALSPAFLLFNENTWNKYLKNLDFKGNYPLFYMYNGDGDELESKFLLMYFITVFTTKSENSLPVPFSKSPKDFWSSVTIPYFICTTVMVMNLNQCY